MLRPRLIVCLDVDHGRVVKGTAFKELRDVGDPVELATRYESQGADEIVFLDVSASHEGRRTLLDTVQRTAEALFIPLTVGGGVGSVQDIGSLLRAGADKISMNTAAVRDPELITRAAERFGSQCVVASIDAARDASIDAARDASVDGAREVLGWRVYTHGGRTPTDRDGVAWATDCAERGAGEILLTSIDQDGARSGYDLKLTAAVAHAVHVPVIASGGAGEAAHVRDALVEGGAAAALVAGILHDGLATVGEIKADLTRWGVNVR